jgi:hypothetical protein
MPVRLVPALSLVLVLVACGDKNGGDSSAEATHGPDDLPPAAEVCAAACEKFTECADPGPECEEDCLAGISFLAMNNPGSGCDTREIELQHCFSKLTCEEIDAFVMHADGATYPCKEEDEALGVCAVE